MSDHTIVIIWVVKIFLYSSSVYSCHLFLISSASVRSIPFLSFIDPIFAGNVPFVSLLAILWNSAFRCLYFSFSPLLFAWLPLGNRNIGIIFLHFIMNMFIL